MRNIHKSRVIELLTEFPQARDNDGILGLRYCHLYNVEYHNFILYNLGPKLARTRAHIQAQPLLYPNLQASPEVRAKRKAHEKEMRQQHRNQGQIDNTVKSKNFKLETPKYIAGGLDCVVIGNTVKSVTKEEKKWYNLFGLIK